MAVLSALRRSRHLSIMSSQAGVVQLFFMTPAASSFLSMASSAACFVPSLESSSGSAADAEAVVALFAMVILLTDFLVAALRPASWGAWDGRARQCLSFPSWLACLV